MPKSSSPSPTVTPMIPIKTQPLPQTQTLTATQTSIPNHSLTLTHHQAEDGDDRDLLQSYHLNPQSLLMEGEDEAEPAASHPNPLHQLPPSLNRNQTLDQEPVHNPPPLSPSPFSSLLFRDPDEEEEEEEEEELIEDEEEDIEGEEVDEDQKPTVKPSPSTSYNGVQHQHPSDPISSSSTAGLTPINTDHGWAPVLVQPLPAPHVDPAPHVSSQFYTFNRDSHALMVRCILEGRLATPDEIRQATPCSVLKSWRSVWKDRNEDTAYLTAWKRIQDKLHAHLDAHGNPSLYFKNNPSQCVSHVDQWQGIVSSYHADPDLLRHLGLKETVDRIKQSWTVGAKFYGIPESFIRVCVASCPVCSSASTGAGSTPSGGGAAAARSKRRRFEYTESFDVPAQDVPRRLQQLAAKHKVVLCIRQKYIRYKPFMAEVKDYACHRAGEPSSASGSSKKARVLKREPYQSKRCGCGFRIRAIVPITNYNEKDKTFVYQEEGTAVFKLYAVHSGHEPGPLDGNARIIHRVVGHKGGFDLDPLVYGVQEDIETESFVNLMVKDGSTDLHHVVLQQLQELRVEAGLLEGKIAKMPLEQLGSMSRELFDILHRLRSVGGAQHSEALVVGDDEVGQWGDDCDHLDGHDRIFGKDSEIIEGEEADFGSSLGAVVPWDRMAAECHGRKMLMRESCKPDKWLMKEDSGDFDEKCILNCGEDSKLIKPIRHDGTIETDPSLVAMQVDGFYPDNTKWYDSPSGLDTGAGSEDGGFRHGGIV